MTKTITIKITDEDIGHEAQAVRFVAGMIEQGYTNGLQPAFTIETEETYD